MTQETNQTPLTVAALIQRLSAYPSDRQVVFIDPDTQSHADVIVREPDDYEAEKYQSPPLVVTGNPYG